MDRMVDIVSAAFAELSAVFTARVGVFHRGVQLRPGHWPLTELYLLAGCVCRLSAITREPCSSVKQLRGHRLQAAS